MTSEEKLAYFVPGMVGYYGKGSRRELARVLSDEGDKAYGKDQRGNIYSLPTFAMVKVKILSTGAEKLAVMRDLEPVDPLMNLGAQSE
jgi:hypothetical protein